MREFAASFSEQFATIFILLMTLVILPLSFRSVALLIGQPQTWWSDLLAAISVACSTASLVAKRTDQRKRRQFKGRLAVRHHPLLYRSRRCRKLLQRLLQSRRHEGDRRQRRRGPPGGSKARCAPDNGSRQSRNFLKPGRCNRWRARARPLCWNRCAGN